MTEDRDKGGGSSALQKKCCKDSKLGLCLHLDRNCFRNLLSIKTPGHGLIKQTGTWTLNAVGKQKYCTVHVMSGVANNWKTNESM